MIRVENVSKQFNKTRALKNVSLEVNKGDIISLIGPSGSGKSTLLRCIHGLEHVDTGKIYMDNEWMNPDDEKKFRTQRNRMGFVFQHFNLFPNMSVLQNCKLAQVEVLNKTDEEAEKIALEYLDKVGLLEKKDAYPNNLSGGQKQRVAIAGILAIEPDIIILMNRQVCWILKVRQVLMRRFASCMRKKISLFYQLHMIWKRLLNLKMS